MLSTRVFLSVTEPSRAARPLALRPRLTAGLPLSRDPVLLGCPFAPPIGPGGRLSEPEFAWMDECSVRRECTPGTPAAVRRRTEPARVGNSALCYSQEICGRPTGGSGRGLDPRGVSGEACALLRLRAFQPWPSGSSPQWPEGPRAQSAPVVTSPDRVAAASRLGADGGSVPSPSPFLSSAGSDGRGS
jgi:hypothetical protein